MLIRKFVSVSVAVVCLAGAGFAQSSAGPTIIPLTVDKGFPLQVRLTEKLQFKQNESVHGVITEPIYAFDREVIPSGTQIEGKITGFKKASTWKRISAMLGGDFTPIRDPLITFDTLVFSDGKQIPIQTSAIPAADKLISSDGKGDA